MSNNVWTDIYGETSKAYVLSIKSSIARAIIKYVRIKINEVGKCGLDFDKFKEIYPYENAEKIHKVLLGDLMLIESEELFEAAFKLGIPKTELFEYVR